MMLLLQMLLQLQFCSFSTPNSTRPPKLGHESSMDMTYKYNVNNNFLFISCEKKVNDNFCPTLNSTRPLGPDYASSIDMTMVLIIFSYFEDLKAGNMKNDDFSLIPGSRGRVIKAA